MKEYRRVPLSMLRKRLKVEEYECEAPFTQAEPKPERVRIKLKQHAGKPAAATVSAGQRVIAGETVGRMAEKELGADVHSSIDGVVAAIAGTYIEIQAEG
jgi:Na+-translocating ferredoxin:NAD+ oxidoreductase RnfC subunit